MAVEIAKVYEFDSLEKYSWSQRLLIRLADIVFFLAISIIGWTIRWKVEGIDNLQTVGSAAKLPIYCVWHNRIFAGTYYLRHRKIVVITSQSLDGEYIARFLKRLGFGTIRGSSTRGGVRALVEMIRRMRDGMAMAFTVDGPRGPRYIVKKGAVLLAKKTGNPLLPFTVEADRFWTINSWDKLQIPKPFTRARLIYAAPIYVEPEAGDRRIEEKRIELQAALESISAG
ncbi:MAG TPA: lysophospholipid acyltransferase family protein [Pyrinomonadaceae bacterium]